jgi:hypothetical protein
LVSFQIHRQASMLQVAGVSGTYIHNNHRPWIAIMGIVEGTYSFRGRVFLPLGSQGHSLWHPAARQGAAA